ncbi:MAG: penicillin-binding protein 2, partial [Rhizobiaceae bacterium]|nr:penicillin-binding protein 2 [Rhizobiaceae bacterium]
MSSDIVQTGGIASQLSLQGASKAAGEQARSRIFLAMLIVGLVYSIIIGRLAYLGVSELDGPSSSRYSNLATSATRPDIVDRNGELLATDIITSSLFAEPRRIVDVDEAVELLTTVLPELDVRSVHRKLASKAGFVWLKRELTPRVQSEILALGIPGIGFRSETKRFYPKGETLSHLVGYVDIDNVGIAGLEKYIDDRGLNDLRDAGFAQGVDMKPVKLSIDTRVQHFIRDE